MKEVDRDIFLLINAANDVNSPLVVFAYAMAKYLIYAVPFGITWLWVRGDDTERRGAQMLLIAVLTAISLSWSIGLLFPVDRPFLEPIGHNLLTHRPSPSFPSNHGLVMFTCAWSLLLMSYKWQAAVAGTSGLLIAWSRIYLGIHWPSDMVGALFIALVAAFLARFADRCAGESLLPIAVGAYQMCVLKPISNVRKRFM